MGEFYRYKKGILSISIFVSVLCVAVMTAWITHIDHVTSVIPGQATMKFNTALSCLLLGISLICILTRYKQFRVVAYLLAIISCILGLLSLLEHIIPETIRIDRFFYDQIMAEENPQGRFLMSPQTALCIFFMGVALLLIKANDEVRAIIQYILHIVTLLSFIVVVGYLYKVPNFHDLSMISSMAVPTAVILLLLSVAASLVNPSLGATSIFTGNRIGNHMARRMFFSLVIAIVSIGYIRMLCHKYDLFSVEVGIAFITVTFVMISLALIWYTSKRLNNFEVKNAEAHESLQVMLDAAPYSIIKTDGFGKILMLNKQTEKLFGYSKEELIGNGLAILIPQRFHTLYLENQKMVQENLGIHNINHKEEIFAMKKNGKEFPVEVIVCSLNIQGKRNILVSLIDITLRRDNEKTIIRQLEELQSKNQELEQFNYISSHDLQEPLRTVMNYVEMLEEDYPDLTDEVKQHHKAIYAAAGRMSTVVRSLLDFGRLGRNKKLVLTNINVVLNDVTADLHNLISGSGAVININCNLPELYAYEAELRQLFQNLISNAIKFGKDATTPEIDITCTLQPGCYEFAISDNGIGIDPKYHEKIFLIFQRLNKEEDYEGHGLGLANCRKIVEMHGGKIWVESVPGEGSTFKFTILNFKP